MEMSAKNKDTIVDEEDKRVSFLETLVRSGVVPIEFANGLLESEAFRFTDQERDRVMKKLNKLGKSADKNPKRSSEEDVKEVLIGCMHHLGSEATEGLKEGMKVSDDIWAAAMSEYATGIPDPQKPASSSQKPARKKKVTMEKSSLEKDAKIEDLFVKLHEVGGTLVKTMRNEVVATVDGAFELQNPLIQGSIKSEIDERFKSLLSEVGPAITEAVGEGVKAFKGNLTHLVKEALKSELFDSTYGKALISIQKLKDGLEEAREYQAALAASYMEPNLKVLLSTIPPAQGHTLLNIANQVSDDIPYWSSERLTEIVRLVDLVDETDRAVVLCGHWIFYAVICRLSEVSGTPWGQTQSLVISSLWTKLANLVNSASFA